MIRVRSRDASRAHSIWWFHASRRRVKRSACAGSTMSRSLHGTLPPQFPAKAKRVIYLHMAGAPSQLELFDYKPDLRRLDGQDCPASFLEGKRFAFISGVPKMLGPQFPFHQTGKSGTWISDRLPF